MTNHDEAMEAARKIVALADRFKRCRTEFPIEKDWDFDACSEHEEPLLDACIDHGELLARALLALTLHNTSAAGAEKDKP